MQIKTTTTIGSPTVWIHYGDTDVTVFTSIILGAYTRDDVTLHHAGTVVETRIGDGTVLEFYNSYVNNSDAIVAQFSLVRLTCYVMAA